MLGPVSYGRTGPRARRAHVDRWLGRETGHSNNEETGHSNNEETGHSNNEETGHSIHHNLNETPPLQYRWHTSPPLAILKSKGGDDPPIPKTHLVLRH